MNNGALYGTPPWRQADFASIRQRTCRIAAEPGRDVITWMAGVLAAAWITHDISAATVTPYLALRAAGGVCAAPLVAGLLAGLYRGRRLRGSLEEVAAVGVTAVLASAVLAALTTLLVPGQRVPLATVACGAALSLLGMMGGRYLLFAVRRRSRKHPPGLLGGMARIEGVRDPRVGELLGRRPVETGIVSVASHFTRKRILVTGAGGSIGSELYRQLHRYEPAELIMLDRDESALHAVQLDLHGRALFDSDGSVQADIRDHHRIRQIFEQFQPQIVFHAAALKHLPLLERYPGEALKTNVWGTCTVLAAACGVESFVNISTGKAADPVSMLGYSKRAAERLTAYMATPAAGTYLSVRFGNVLGSRGSVLTAMAAQVAAGDPVTVTHPEVSRYFMTADQAVQLVLQAAVIGRSGEVLVLDMGEQVRIVDMARRLVAAVPRQVDIIFTGLRPGEKLAEVLLGLGEQDERPCHPLIRHVPVVPLSPETVVGLDPADGLAGLRAALADPACLARLGADLD